MGILQRLAIERLKREQRYKEARIKALAKNHHITTLPDGSKCHCLHLYYSVYRHGYDIPDDAMEFRKNIYAFKDGDSSGRWTFGREVVALLQELYGEQLIDMCFCTAQATTQYSAEQRFKKFCEYISEKTSVANGFEYIKVNFDQNRQTRELIIEPLVKGKRLILLDDITTTGWTLSSIRKLLLEAGATSVDCFAIGMTV
jgi:phosphoribosylpyrophosphate synthetase